MYMRGFFFLIIPVRAPHPRAYHSEPVEAHLEPTTQELIETQPQTARSILIVDDSRLVTQALRTFLDKAGFTVATFESGLAALRHAAQNPPDAAVIDIHLPDINGLVLTQRLRELLGPQTPLIILSGDTSIQTINSLTHVGATYFFPKPIQGAQLVERLKQWID